MKQLRADFLQAVQGEDFMRFTFVDQTSTNLTYHRRYGRAPGGQRAVPLHRAANLTLLAALDEQGLGAAMTVEGAVNATVFAVYLDQGLGPTLQPGDVVVLDGSGGAAPAVRNLPVHKTAGLAQLVEKRGARLLFLPPYSPDFNPIELAFSKLKTWWRTVQARTRPTLEEAIRQALAWISPQDAQNWFDHCGFHIH